MGALLRYRFVIHIERFVALVFVKFFFVNEKLFRKCHLCPFSIFVNWIVRLFINSHGIKIVDLITEKYEVTEIQLKKTSQASTDL